MSSATEAYERLMGWKPNPMQEAVFPVVQGEDCALLLESPTGSGKTEAVLVPALMAPTPRRLFLIYPARSLIEDQIARMEEKVLPRVSANGRRVALVIDHGEQSERQVWVNGKKISTQKRHLYDGDVIVTTLDKFLYRFFGYGGQTKSYIFPFRIHHGARAPLFCFDEAHSYEDIAFSNFVDLVRALYIKGLDLVVMTATMPPAQRASLDFLEDLNFVDDPNNLSGLTKFYQDNYSDRKYPGKRLKYIQVADDKLVETLIAQASNYYSSDRRIIVVAEEVRDAADIYTALRKQQHGDHVLLYHGRFPHAVRRETYRQLKERDIQGLGYLLVTTSAIEVGCDLDAHVLITEVCNPEQLIQRAGRCNRRDAVPDAQLIVVGDHIKPYLRSLSENDEAEYLETLRNLNGQILDVAAIRKCIRTHPQPDYRVQMLFRMLYEYVYEARRVNRPLHEKGLVITRSWEPSLTLTTAVGPDGEMENPVSISWSMCAAKDEKELTPGCQLYRRSYSNDDGQWHIEPVTGGGGCAYFNDLVLVAPSEAYDQELGYVKVPKVFLDRPAGGYRHWLVYHTTQTAATKRPKKEEVWFWYVDRLPEVSEEESLEDSGNADEHSGSIAGDE